MLPYVQRVLTKDGERVAFALGVPRGEGQFGGLSSLPKRGETRWSGPWTAESGIHPGSRNNLLVSMFLFFSFPKRETPLSRVAG